MNAKQKFNIWLIKQQKKLPEVAKDLGISTSNLRNAINGKSSVKLLTAMKIEKHTETSVTVVDIMNSISPMKIEKTHGD